MNNPVVLSPRRVSILAEAYELKPWEVVHDSATIQVWCWSGLELLVHWCNKYDWDVSSAIYYTAALRRAVREAQDSHSTWPAD